MAGGKIWTAEEIEFLTENYHTATKSELLEALPDRTYPAIKKKAENLGLSSRSTARAVVPLSTRPKEISERIETDRRVEGMKAEVAYYKRLYEEVIKRLNVQDLVREVVAEVAHIIPSVTVIASKPMDRTAIGEAGTETDVLQISDLHGGEEVRAEETMGLSAFDMEILNQRLYKLFAKTLSLVELRRSQCNIQKLIIAQLGDMLSGEIHEELVRTNVGHMMGLAVRVAHLVSQGIASLTPHFDEIEVWCIPGNHTRLRKRPYYKEKYLNWDYMLYQQQAVICRDLDNVTFHIPQSPYALVNAENTRLLLMHGDSIRSWMGIPWYGIDRAAKRLSRMLQVGDDYYDALLLGHFHNRADIDIGIGPMLINGSMKGGDEFSIGSMQTISKPSQNLLHFHSEHGYIGGEPIYVEEDPDDPMFEDVLPEVWMDLSDGVKRGVTLELPRGVT